MQISTICRKWIVRALAVAFWILVWQLVSMAVNSEILVASPARTFLALLSLMRDAAFYGTLIPGCRGCTRKEIFAVTWGWAR